MIHFLFGAGSAYFEGFVCVSFREVFQWPWSSLPKKSMDLRSNLPIQTHRILDQLNVEIGSFSLNVEHLDVWNLNLLKSLGVLVTFLVGYKWFFKHHVLDIETWSFENNPFSVIRLHGGHERTHFGDCYLTVHKGLQGDVLGGCENAKVSWWKFVAHPAPRIFQELCELSWSKRLVQQIEGKIPSVIGFWNLGFLSNHFWWWNSLIQNRRKLFPSASNGNLRPRATRKEPTSNLFGDYLVGSPLDFHHLL